jgi:hypothetical protein
MKAVSSQIILQLLIIVIFPITLIGCDGFPNSGKYRGNLTLHEIAHQPEAEKLPVWIEVKYQHSELRATVFDADTHVELIPALVFSKLHGNSMSFQLQNFLEQKTTTYNLEKAKANTGHCFETSSSEPVSEAVSLCFDHENFDLNIQGKGRTRLHLYGTLFTSQLPLQLEAQQTLTVWEGADRIIAKNYDVRESLQVLLRAHEIAHRAYLNFIPHISVGGASLLGDLVTGGWDVSGKQGIDLVSFIFPGRWLKAKGATWGAFAQELTTMLLRLNLGTSVQSMSVALNADHELRDELAILKDKITKVQTVAKALAAENRVDSNFVYTIEIALSDLSFTYFQAQNKYLQDRMDLAKILAFENPEAVEDLILGLETTPMDQIPLLTAEELEVEKKIYADIAVKNSFELMQLEYLHRYSILNLKNMYVEWLDTNSNLDLGFKLIPQSKIYGSLIKSIEIKSEKTRQSLIVKAYNLVRDRNILKQNFNTFDASLTYRKERLNLLLERFHEFASSTDPDLKVVAPSDIRGSLKDVTSGLQGYFASFATVVMDQTALDRLALRGVYEKFVPQLSVNELSN